MMGLTSSEIRAYLALLKKGTAEAKTVHKLSGVPFGKIYQVLYSLENRGLLSVQYSRPKLFMATPPATAVKALLKSKEDELEKFLDMAPEAEEELNRIHIPGGAEDNFWTVITDRLPMEKILERVSTETREELMAYFNHPLEDMGGIIEGIDIDAAVERLSGMQDRGVSIKVLRGVRPRGESGSDLIFGKVDGMNGIDVRYTEFFTNPFIVVDREKVFFIIWDPLSTDLSSIATIYLWNRQLARKLVGRFEELWKISDEGTDD
ncbi:MAG: helix-turn-helix domain-containing protein [Thermoplasmatota archaeon]